MPEQEIQEMLGIFARSMFTATRTIPPAPRGPEVQRQSRRRWLVAAHWRPRPGDKTVTSVSDRK